MANLASVDRLNILYFGEMELPAAEKKMRIVMSGAFQDIVRKYYDTVHAIIADEKTDKRRKDILLAAAVVSLRKAYLGFFDKYYERYVAAIFQGGEPYYGTAAWRDKHALDFAVWLTRTARNEPNVAFENSHSIAVARTEINAMSNLAALDAAYRSGARFKTWVMFGDGKVRPSHKAADGTRIPIDEAFTVGGYKLMFPNDTSLGAGAEEIVNCRCTLRFDGGKPLTNAGERGIMRAGSDDVALENQRYGRNKSTLVNKSYIEGGEYRRKFDKLSDNPEVNKALYNAAKTALKHRSGTDLEDMYWFDGKTGEILAKEVNNTVPRQVDYSIATKHAINHANDKSLIALHTHPSSMPPSAGDLNACFNHGYKCGYIACHDGRVFGYTADERINETLYDLYIKNGINDGLSEFDAQIAALNKMKLRFKIDFWEVD